MEPSHQSCPPYNTVSDTLPGFILGLGLQTPRPATPPNSNVSGSHYYRIGVPQQSPVFNSIMTGQGQTLYNSVFGAQTSFTGQTSFSQAPFNGCAETPMWFTDSRPPVSSTSTTMPMIETDRMSGRLQFIDKSASCCVNRIGVLENIGMCSPLTTETFKNTNKEFFNIQQKHPNSMIDSPSWSCNPPVGIPGYGNQHNGFKCNEQFSSCSVSQINVVLPEPSDLKHSSNFNIDSPCFLPSTHNQISGCSNKLSPSKHTNQANCEPSRFEYLNKEHSSVPRYACSLQKHSDERLDHCVMKNQHQYENFGNVPSVLLPQSCESHDIANNTQTQLKRNANETRKNRSLPFQQNGNIVAQIPIFQQHFHDPSVSCESSENCFLADSKMTKYTVPVPIPVKRSCLNTMCCDVMRTCERHMLISGSTNQFALKQSQQDSSENKVIPSVPLHSSVASQIDCNEIRSCVSVENFQAISKLHNVKDSVDVSSVGGESDIIVEESEDETNSEISVEEVRTETTAIICYVCKLSATKFSSVDKSTQSPTYTNIKTETPTTPSHIPVTRKIAQVIKNNESLRGTSMINSHICKICLNLTYSIDCLEKKLALLKQNLQERYNLGQCEVMKIENGINLKNVAKKKILMQSNIEKHQTECNLIDKKCYEVKTQVPVFNFDIKNHSTVGSKTVNKIGDTKQGKTESKLKKHQCLVCCRFFSSESYLEKHKQTHTKEYSFYCEHCGKGFMLKRILDNHVLLHNGESQYQCEICGKLFIQQFNLETHIRKHNDDYRVNCAQCGKGFMSITSLKIHLRTHSNDRPFICQHCGRRFGTTSNLDSHVKLCSNESDNFTCTKCKETFSSRNRLRRHALLQHEGGYRGKCAICGKGFMKESDRKAHMATHSIEKKFKCSSCGKCYKSLGNLNQHSKKHSTERPFKCSLCGEGFLRKNSFTNHLNKHSGFRPFSCEQCSKTFTMEKNLQQHQRWHAGTLKCYICTVCGKTVRHGLKVHMRTHTGVKPYKCLKCDKAFSVKSTLNKHLQFKHSPPK